MRWDISLLIYSQFSPVNTSNVSLEDRMFTKMSDENVVVENYDEVCEFGRGGKSFKLNDQQSDLNRFDLQLWW